MEKKVKFGIAYSSKLNIFKKLKKSLPITLRLRLSVALPAEFCELSVNTQESWSDTDLMVRVVLPALKSVFTVTLLLDCSIINNKLDCNIINNWLCYDIINNLLFLLTSKQFLNCKFFFSSEWSKSRWNKKIKF